MYRLLFASGKFAIEGRVAVRNCELPGDLPVKPLPELPGNM